MKYSGTPITQEKLTKLFTYDAARDLLLWKSPRSNRVKDGEPAGFINKASGSRRYINVDGRIYRADYLIGTFLNGTGPIRKQNAQYWIERPLTHKSLLEAVRYNPETGMFFWKIIIHARKGCKSPGDRADCPQYGKKPYGEIRVAGKKYATHRLAWFYMTGEWPKYFVDHKNGNPSDNRWRNLREATAAENVRNRKKDKRSRSPYKGIQRGRNGKWGASIRLGSYDTPEEAHEAYMNAARIFFGEFASAG